MDALNLLQDRLQNLERIVDQGDRQILMELGNIREKLGTVAGLADRTDDIDVRLGAIERLVTRAGERGLLFAGRAARALAATPGGWRGAVAIAFGVVVAVDVLVDVLGWADVVRAIAQRML